MQETIRLRLIQFAPQLNQVDENIELHRSFIQKAVQDKIELIVFPELSLTGYFLKNAVSNSALSSASKRLESLRHFSKDISILLGGIELSEKFSLHNSAFFFEKAQTMIAHRKIYLPNYGMFEESRDTIKGQSIQVLDTQFGKVGVAICEDLWHLSIPYLYAMQGAKIIFVLSNSPYREGITEIWQRMIRFYAHALSLYIVFVNRVGVEDGISFWGGSEVIAPDGSSIAQAPLFDNAVLDVTISDEMIRSVRSHSHTIFDEDARLFYFELKNYLRQNKDNQ